MVQCFEVECNHASERQKCSFFRIPTSQKIRLEWQNVFDRRKDKKWTPHSRLCSCHFVDGKKENGPTIFHATSNITFKKKSARDLTQTRSPFLSSILGAKGPMRQNPANMAIHRLNNSAMMTLDLQHKKRQQLVESTQNLFSHLQMNFASDTTTKGHGMKRPAPVPIAEIELRDIKPCKKELDTQQSIQLEHTHSQVTPSHHPYSPVTSTEQNLLQFPTSHQNHHQATASHQNHHQATASHQNHHQATASHQNHHQATASHQNYHQATTSRQNSQNHTQAAANHQKHHQATTSRQNQHQVTTSHQSNLMTQSGQQSHSQMTVISQNHHNVTSGQSNHQMSIRQNNYTKINNTGHHNPFEVPTNKLSHQMTSGHKNHQNVTMSHSNPQQGNSGQSIDQQNQSQISIGHQKRQQPNQAQLRFLETDSIRLNHAEVTTGQQQRETLQDSLKTIPEAALEPHLKPSSTPDAVACPTSGSKMSPIPQMNMNTKTITVSKHHSTVMSSLASLWKDSKLCDATIGNANFKIMVHKIVLLAISPKLLAQANIKANCFIRVNLPENVSQEALVAFSKYMYHGVLSLDPNLLRQLRIIALQLGIRELELLCDTHLLYCDLQNSTVNSGFNFPETACPSSLLGSTTGISTSTDPYQRTSAVPECTMVKQEELDVNSSLKDMAQLIKKEPVDHTRDSSTSAQDMLNSPISHNFNDDLLNTNYKQQSLEASVLCGPYDDAFHSTSLEFEPATAPTRQGATDNLLELNDILQIQKFFKKSDLPNFSLSDSLNKSALPLSPNTCASQSNNVIDPQEIGYNKNTYGTNTDNPTQQSCGDKSRKHSVIESSERTSQSLEVLKESAKLLTFQITDVRSVDQTVDLT